MAGRSRLPMDIQLSIAEEYRSGERTGDLATKYGFNRKTIIQVARRMGCKMRHQHYMSGRPRMNTEAMHDEVRKLREEGVSQQNIGKLVGVSQAVVGRILGKIGMPRRVVLAQERHGNWKGGVVTTGSGYTAVSGGEFPEMRDMNGYTLEHRLVMARHLGRPLTRHETVHHINGDRKDNRIENLQLRKGKHGKGVRFICACCGSKNIIEAEID